MAKGGKKLTPEEKGYNDLICGQEDTSDIKFDVSFRYFHQIEYFQIGNCNSSWICSFLDQIKNICNFTEKELFSTSTKTTLRIHPIKWNKSDFRRETFDWLPKDILNNETEYPFFQCEISKGTGRFIFFRHHNTLNIFLIDRYHNLQPSWFSAYKLRKTSLAMSEYDEVLARIEDVKRLVCGDCKKLFDTFRDESSTYIRVDNDLIEKYESLIQDGTLERKFEEFLFSKL